MCVEIICLWLHFSAHATLVDFQKSPSSDFIWRGTAASRPIKARSARQEVDL